MTTIIFPAKIGKNCIDDYDIDDDDDSDNDDDDNDNDNDNDDSYDDNDLPREIWWVLHQMEMELAEQSRPVQSRV